MPHPQARGKRAGNAQSRYGYYFTAPYIVFYLFFGLFPIVYTFCISFTNWPGYGDCEWVGLQNYVRLVTKDPLFFKSIGNTVLLMLGYIPALLLGGLLLAVALFGGRLKGRRFFQFTNFLPYLTTPVAVGLVFCLLFDWSTGMVNRLLAQLGLSSGDVNWLGDPTLARVVVCLMVVWKLMGYHMVFCMAGLTNISPELYDAAKVDGASPWQEFRRITVPMMKNVLSFLLVTDVINGFQLIEEPMMLFTGWMGAGGLVGGPQKTCLTAVWHMYNTAFVSNMNMSRGAAIAYGVFVFIVGFSAVGTLLQKRKGDEL